MDWFGFRFAWPRWMPCSNEPFRFFEPVFNFADAAISVGFVALILFYRRELSRLMDSLEWKKKK
jgi:signal peptidase II